VILTGGTREVPRGLGPCETYVTYWRGRWEEGQHGSSVHCWFTCSQWGCPNTLWYHQEYHVSSYGAFRTKNRVYNHKWAFTLNGAISLKSYFPLLVCNVCLFCKEVVHSSLFSAEVLYYFNNSVFLF